MSSPAAVAAGVAGAGVAIYCCAPSSDRSKQGKVVHIYRAPGLPPPRIAAIRKIVAEFGVEDVQTVSDWDVVLLRLPVSCRLSRCAHLVPL